ncbi:hypothetical protein DEO23_05810 [Brachybacterium endophyticum]|uniref:Uncharacterized protein n=1 Tax=Brachybacterium endophyticum TaxID=2182385 RepID=A0A2U2RKT7_9MICO|nr:glycosyltransferase [Brachybacterium endophyticum]PWH06483.1 hypothetical protein DEO23_05810 [Brachybacterium endophyticum]
MTQPEVSEKTEPEGSGSTGPEVSVIMAVYNAGTYLEDALGSTMQQGLGATQIEVIAVDDGSTDGSADVLDRFASAHPNVRVIHQENSGGPGGPRNTGLDLATGRYVFFLDADDLLAENGLRELVAVADEQGSDVVLGQVHGIDGRSARGATFPATRLHVDLMEDRIFRTLGPWKLFRRELLEQHGMRFRTDVKVAEDQLLVAQAYLTASVISICADRDYYYLRQREDGGNVTRTKRGPVELVDAFTRLTEVVVANTEPGPLRDAVMWRSVTWSLGKPLDARFLQGSERDQQYVVDRIRAVLAPVYTPGAAEHQEPLLRLKTELALAGETDTLRRVIEWQKPRLKPPRLLRLTDDGAAYDLPEDLARQIGPERLPPPPLSAKGMLLGIEVEGDRVLVRGAARIRRAVNPAPQTLLRLRERESRQVIDVAARLRRAEEHKDGVGAEFDLAVETDRLPEGVWDAWIVQRAGESEAVRRFGGARAADVETGQRELTDADGRARGIVYFTKKASNLSIDIGFQLHPDPNAPEEPEEEQAEQAEAEQGETPEGPSAAGTPAEATSADADVRGTAPSDRDREGHRTDAEGDAQTDRRRGGIRGAVRRILGGR